MTSGRILRRAAIAAGVLGLVAVSGWLLTQHIGFGDEGFFLVTYDRFLDAPEQVARATSAFWLTDVIGALWLRVVPVAGSLALRMGAALAYLACAGLAWLIVRRCGLRNPGAAIGLAFCAALMSGYPYLEYTVLTTLALTAASALLLAGVRNESRGQLAGAGVLLGVGVFLRLPNILFPTLALAPLIFSVIERTSPRRAMIRAAFVIAGVATGVVAVGVLIVLLDHASYIQQALSDLTRDPQPVYSWTRLLTDGTRTALLSAGHGLLLWAVAGVTATLLAPTPRWIQVGGAVVLTTGLVTAHLVVPRAEWYYSVLGTTALAMLLTIATPEAGAERRRSALVALWTLVLIAAGSASLPWPLLLGLWLPLPLTFAVLADVRPRGLPVFFGKTSALHGRLLMTALTTLIVTSVAPITPYIRSLLGQRPGTLPHELAARPSDPRLHHLHTSAPLARAADELLRELSRVVRPGDPMIVSNGIPLVVYLTRAKSFLDHPYPDLLDVPVLRASLSRADWTGPWPIWIRAKYTPSADFFVTHLPGSTFGRSAETRQWLADYLHERGYQRIWENELFEISAPPQERGVRRTP